uniref:Uncharacterized protein n=1 Tax=Chryseobacterium endophyticum TaxID=1854762 RepID=A0AAU6WQ67_9FLAO
MKVILTITLLISNLFLAQEYLLLDDLKTNFKINEYTLDTKDLYNIQKDINVFNIFISKENILLLSVLPDLDENILPRMDERGNNWMIINYDKIKDKVFSKEKMLSMLSDWKMNNTSEKRLFNINLLKKKMAAIMYLRNV